MPTLLNRVSHPLTPVRSIITPRDVMNRQISYYTSECDPLQHIQKHEFSLLGRISDDNHFALLFLAMLSGTPPIGF